MAKTRRTRQPHRSLDEPRTYWDAVRRPLQILAFLLPLIILYEFALVFVLQSQENVRTVLAHRYLLDFFDAFRIAPRGALHLGGIAIVVVLLVWHVLERRPWRVSIRVCGIMAAESLALTLPLIVLWQVIARAAAAEFGPAAEPPLLQGLNLWSKVGISIGAGLYEELLFRMLLIAVIHTLLVDVGKASDKLGAGIAILVSAAAFTAYHRLGSSSEMAFLFLAGVYFGCVYVIRGFGIVVGTHAFYDILTVALLAGAGRT
jgi:membrane protease YdiL (CAAX protease family)